MAVSTSKSQRRMSAMLRAFNCSSSNDGGGIITSKYPDLEIPSNMSISDYVMSNFDHYGDKVAVIDGLTNKSYTYRQLKDLIHRCGSGLSRAGFQQGDVCALYLPNMSEYCIPFYAVISIGGIVTTINPSHTSIELVHQLIMSDAKWIVTLPDVVDNIKSSNLYNIKHTYILGDGNVEGCLPFADLMTDDGSAFPKDIKINPVEDVAVLPYSSGTTGRPKGVMLTHQNLIASCEIGISTSVLKKSDIICVLPLYHLSGMHTHILLGLKQGNTTVLLPKFQPEVFLRLAEKHKVSQLFVAPPLAVFLIKHPMVDKYNLSSVDDIVCGAAPLGLGHVKSLKRRLNNDELTVRQVYGMTETSGFVTSYGLNDTIVAGSAGRLVAGCQAKVTRNDVIYLWGQHQKFNVG
uniref:4-coumarate--CoA ligase 3-like n=1 Tax=Saccoglossus kowalevskii TaxID=10224 RepID=A0ABM0MMS9_SACKO|nr:PREDICTED: 4-coumarate--CoA ligase 3-like [Saccoglossus kowalevskii]